MRLFVTAFTAVCLLVGANQAESANLISNGSFEDTTGFIGNADDTMVLGSGSTTMNGWTVVNSGLAWIGPANPFSLTASAGNYFLDLTSYTDSPPYGGVAQTIATTPGATYLLQFDLGSSNLYGLPDSITASAGNASQTFTSTLNVGNGWETESLSFTALGSSTVVNLTGNAGFEYIGLDNVSVTLTSSPVPEPGSLTVIGLGLASIVGFGWARRRKAKAAIL
jgi:hypothetical protein